MINVIVRLLQIGMLSLLAQNAFAEPYLSVKSGLQCAVCHVSPTGGGMRTEFGQIYGRTLAQDKTKLSELETSISHHIRIGADLRTTLRFDDQQNQDQQSQFNSDRTTLYVSAEIIPQRLSFYVDQQFAPSSINRTAWLKLDNDDQSLYLRAGKFFLPYGFRLEDDSAFIRQVTGVNFASADNGVELGFSQGHVFTQLSLTNGTQGAAEIDNNKQLSLRSVYLLPYWRFGFSLNSNQGNGVKRSMANVFSGFQAMGAQFLVEYDRVKDKTNGINVSQDVFLAEVNYELKVGHSLKYTYEYHDPNINIDEDQRIRNSVVWEYSPYQQFQVRTGLRVNTGIPQKDQDNGSTLFTNVHLWF